MNRILLVVFAIFIAGCSAYRGQTAQDSPEIQVLSTSVKMQAARETKPNLSVEKLPPTTANTQLIYNAAIYKSRYVEFQRVAMSPNGKLLAAAGIGIRGKTPKTIDTNALLLLLDARTGKRLRFIWKYEVQELTFSPDGKWLITGGTKARWWNVATGKLWREVETSNSSLTVSADEKIWAVADHESNRLDIWQKKPFKLQQRFGFMADPGRIALSPSGQEVTSSTGLIYDIGTSEIRRWPRSSVVGNFEQRVASSPGEDLVSIVKMIRNEKGVYNNQTIISSTRSKRKLWSIAFSVFPSSRSVFSPDGKRIVLLHLTSYNEKRPSNILARLYEAKTGRLVQTIQRENAQDLLEATDAVFSSDGRNLFLAGSGLDNVLKIVRLAKP